MKYIVACSPLEMSADAVQFGLRHDTKHCKSRDIVGKDTTTSMLLLYDLSIPLILRPSFSNIGDASFKDLRALLGRWMDAPAENVSVFLLLLGQFTDSSVASYS